MKTLLTNLLNKILKYFKDPKVLTSKENNIFKTRLNNKTVLDLLIAQTARDYLLRLKEELEKEFTRKQGSTINIKYHSDDHIKLIANMHSIQSNITKVINEIQTMNGIINDLSNIMKKEINLEVTDR